MLYDLTTKSLIQHGSPTNTAKLNASKRKDKSAELLRKTAAIKKDARLPAAMEVKLPSTVFMFKMPGFYLEITVRMTVYLKADKNAEELNSIAVRVEDVKATGEESGSPAMIKTESLPSLAYDNPLNIEPKITYSIYLALINTS